MELNKFTIGLILVALVIFVGAIAAHTDDFSQNTTDLNQSDDYVLDIENTYWIWGASPYDNESDVVVGFLDRVNHCK